MTHQLQGIDFYSKYEKSMNPNSIHNSFRVEYFKGSFTNELMRPVPSTILSNRKSEESIRGLFLQH